MPSTSSRPPLVGGARDLDEVAVQVAGHHAVDEVRRRRGVVVLLHGVEGHPLGPPAVAQVGRRRALLGDRGAVLADPPVVDHLRHDVERAGEEGPGGRRLVLVPHALGPLEPLRAPERRAEQLVPREHVAEDLGVLAGGDASLRLAVQPAHPGRLVQAVGLPAGDRARHEVGARLVERARPAWRARPGAARRRSRGTRGSRRSRARSRRCGPSRGRRSARAATRTRWSRAAYPSAIAPDPSGEPSSTTTTSRSTPLWPSSAVERLREPALHVVHRDDDRDARQRPLGSSPEPHEANLSSPTG